MLPALANQLGQCPGLSVKFHHEDCVQLSCDRLNFLLQGPIDVAHRPTVATVCPLQSKARV